MKDKQTKTRDKIIVMKNNWWNEGEFRNWTFDQKSRIHSGKYKTIEKER